MSLSGAKLHQVHPYVSPPKPRDDFDDYCRAIEAMKRRKT